MAGEGRATQRDPSLVTTGGGRGWDGDWDDEGRPERTSRAIGEGTG